MNRFTLEERQKFAKIALERRKNGEKMADIAKSLNVGKSSLIGWMTNNGHSYARKPAEKSGPVPALKAPIQFSSIEKKKGITVIAIGDETHINLALESIAQIIRGGC